MSATSRDYSVFSCATDYWRAYAASMPPHSAGCSAMPVFAPVPGPMLELLRGPHAAKILLLGTPWNSCTALHLAEYTASYPGRRQGLWPVPVATSTGVSWAAADELLVWEDDFGSLGAAFEMETPHAVSAASAGTAACRLIDMRKVVRFAEARFLDDRDLRGWLAPPGWASVRDAADPLPVPPLSGCLATNEGRQ